MIAPKKIALLEALARYKFLTRLQMAKLGIEKYTSAFSKYLKPLVEADYIGIIDATTYGIGHVYYLKKKGASFIERELQKESSQIQYCQNKPKLSPQGIFHRTHAIDCQIELFETCKKEDVEILFYDRDIEALGNAKRDNNLTRKTRIPIHNLKHLEPDAIFMLDTPKGKKLYCLEYEHKDYTKKSYQKALLHVQALNLKSPSKKYGHDRAHRTLFIYNNKSTMESVVKQLHNSVSGIENWFLFKSYEEVNSGGNFKSGVFQKAQKKDFFEDWQLCNCKRIDLF